MLSTDLTGIYKYDDHEFYVIWNSLHKEMTITLLYDDRKRSHYTHTINPNDLVYSTEESIRLEIKSNISLACKELITQCRRRALLYEFVEQISEEDQKMVKIRVSPSYLYKYDKNDFTVTWDYGERKLYIIHNDSGLKDVIPDEIIFRLCYFSQNFIDGRVQKEIDSRCKSLISKSEVQQQVINFVLAQKEVTNND